MTDQHPTSKRSLKTPVSATLALLAGLLSAGSAQAADFEIRLGHVTSDKEPVQQAIEEFAANVEKRSEGRVDIKIFANGLLGTNPEVYEQVRAGAPIITVSDPGYLSDFVADFGVLGGPYLMDDPMQFAKLEGTELYDNMKTRLRNEAGIELLAMNWLFGSRHLIADKPVSSPDDIAGMTVRTPPNAMWVKTFEAMGARPTQLPWTEVYSGLSAGVVDAAEAPLPSLYGAKLHEVKKVISLTGHFKGFTGLVINADYFNNLPEDIQIILSEEALAAGKFMTSLMLESQEEWIAKLEAEGVTFNRDVDTAAFQKKTASVYKEFPAWSDGLYDNVRAILDN